MLFCTRKLHLNLRFFKIYSLGLIPILILLSLSSTAKIINVVNYGADSTGLEDSYDAIKEAHSDAISGDVIYFPTGTYLISKSFRRYYLFTMKSGVAWLGEEEGKVTLTTPQPPIGEIIRFFNTPGGASNVIDEASFKNLTFKNCITALRFEDTKNCAVENCTFINATIILFATLEEGKYGNTDLSISNCTFDNPNYQDTKNNPSYDKNKVYNVDELAQFKYYNQFLIRIMTYPWAANQPGSAKNDNVIIENCFFRGATYNAVEVAGLRNTNTTVKNCTFTDNFGVAIDFDKGASYCQAIQNKIYNMWPTQQYASDQDLVAVEMQAVSFQDGGSNVLTSKNNTLDGNQFKQTNVPYRKIKTRDGYHATIKNNEILEGDIGGEAISITYTTFLTGNKDQPSIIENNNFRTGDIIIGGTSGGKTIQEPIIFKNNEFNDRLQFFSKVFDEISFLEGNIFNWNKDVDNPAIKVSTAINNLVFKGCVFNGQGNSIDLNDNVNSLVLDNSTFTGLSSIILKPKNTASITSNNFRELVGNTAVQGTAPSFIFNDNIFCTISSSTLFSLTNSNNLQLVNNLKGDSQSNNYSTQGSTVTKESGNFWQGAIDANCDDINQPLPTPDYAYEAENATIYKGVVNSNNQGFTGTGFVNYDNEIGSYVEWEVSSNATGKTTITIQYSNGTDQDRAMEITINGKVVASNLAFNGTGSWETWEAQHLEIELQQGTNTIRATSIIASGGPNIDYLQVPPVIPTEGNGTGLAAEYFNNKTLSGSTALTRTDENINFNWENGSPDSQININGFSARWTGEVQPLYSETYIFETESDDGIKLWVNGQLLVDIWQDMGPTKYSGTISLIAGEKYSLKIEYYENAGGAVAKLRWKSTSQDYQIIPKKQLYSTSISSGVFQQSNAGLVEIEVENYHNNLNQGGHKWEEVNPIGFSGTAALKATPNTGVNINTGNLTNSPRLDYKVNFVQTGTHYIWTRGIGANGNDDSYHAGLDGTISTSADRISTFGTNWTWSKKTMDGPDATLNVSSLGEHTFNIWMREDGFVIDKVIITTDVNYQPTDNNARIINFIAPGEGNKLELTLYPNHVTRLLTLEGIDLKGARLKITNVVGQVVLEKELRQSTIDFTSFSEGIYIIAIEKDGKVFSGKVVKE